MNKCPDYNRLAGDGCGNHLACNPPAGIDLWISRRTICAPNVRYWLIYTQFFSSGGKIAVAPGWDSVPR
jgi:hypothetical protein